MSTRLISADSHVSVQHDQVKDRLEPRFHDAYDDALALALREMLGGNAAKANRSGIEHTHPAHGRPGYTDPNDRLADMDIDGVDFAVAEVERVATAGCKSLQLPVFPAELGQPDYHDARYDPLWSLIAETGLPVCNHIGLNTALNDLADRDPTPRLAWTMTCMPLSACEALGMWILTGPLVKHTDLKVVFVEPGLGWVAYYLHFLDDMVLRQGYAFPILRGELPSFYYHRNMTMTFIDEPDPIRNLLHRLGPENVVWSSDYPHPVSSWPKSEAIVDALFTGLPDATRDAIVCHNAERVWSL